MLSIFVHSDPFPDVDDPEFVKDAYEGLTLQAEWVLEPGEDTYYPEGAYMVLFEVLVKAMANHNGRACKFLCAKWGLINTMMDSDELDILMPLSYNSCRTVQ